MGKQIKLMADYQCWPLWNIDEPDNIAPQELPLAEQTIEQTDLGDWELTTEAASRFLEEQRQFWETGRRAT